MGQFYWPQQKPSYLCDPHHIYLVLPPYKVMKHTSLLLVLHNNGFTGIGWMSLSSRRLKMTPQKQPGFDKLKIRMSWFQQLMPRKASRSPFRTGLKDMSADTFLMSILQQGSVIAKRVWLTSFNPPCFLIWSRY